MATPLIDAQLEQIQTELFAGRKIQAIKIYRTATGTGLREAKQAVEAIEAELRQRAPERFTATAGKSGCMSMLLLFVSAAFTAWLWHR